MRMGLWVASLQSEEGTEHLAFVNSVDYQL